MCGDTPRLHGTATTYQHKYLWPIRLENESFYDQYTNMSYVLHSIDAAININVLKLNPQIRNFWYEYAASAAHFLVEDSIVLPPLVWDVDANGQTLFPNCDAGYWVASKFGFKICNINTYRLSDAMQYPASDDAYLRGGTCTQCPLNAVAELLSSTIEDCLCVKGYYKSGSGDCAICPPNTYKDLNSNEQQCVPCGPGFESRSGSIDFTKCTQPISIGELENPMPIYTTVLGLLYYQMPVEPGWSEPRAIDQDQTMTTISKPQSLTSVRIKDCTLRVPNKTTTLFLSEQ